MNNRRQTGKKRFYLIYKGLGLQMTTADLFKPWFEDCPACGRKEIKPWLTKANDEVMFNIWRCNYCHTCCMNPQPKKEYLDSIYHKSGHGLLEPISYEEVMKSEAEYPNATVDAQRLVIRAQHLLSDNHNLQALDIGSGYGYFTQAAIKSGFQVTAINPGKWENDVFEEMNGFSPIPHFLKKSIFVIKSLTWLF